MKQTIKYPIPNKLPGEEVVYFLRKHWYFFLFLSMMAVFVVLVWFLVLFLFNYYLHSVFVILQGPIIIITGIFLLLLTLFFLASWMTYYFDIVILTNRRIIEIEQKKLFERSIIEVEIVHVEDVSVEVKGLIATFFGYGTISIQTAGTKPNLVLDHIPYPYIFAREITSFYDKLTQVNHYASPSNHTPKLTLNGKQKEIEKPQEDMPKDDEFEEFEKLKQTGGDFFESENNKNKGDR